MRILLFISAFMLFSCEAAFQSKDREQILERLDEQVESWNEGDLEDYMKAYVQSDSLMFIGRSGLTYGYEATLENYKRSYSSKEKMGKLSFEIFQLKPLNTDNALLIGSWRLDRAQDTLSGSFSLNWQRIAGEWVIIADHSS